MSLISRQSEASKEMSDDSRKELAKALLEASGSSTDDLIRKVLQNLATSQKRRSSPDRLKELFNRYLNDHHLFKPGDLVQWKEGLRDRRLPLHGEPAIVIEVLDDPIIDSASDSGSPYFRSRLDVILGVVQSDDNQGDEKLILYYFDSRRFEPFKVNT